MEYTQVARYDRFGGNAKLRLSNRGTHILTTELFLRGFAIVYAIAFASLFSQALGLYGSQGIFSVAKYLTQVSQSLGAKGFWYLPSLFWFNSSDFILQALAAVGILSAIAVFLGYLRLPLFILMWFAYLSYLSVGRNFLSFQWDTFLLEVGFLAIFVSRLSLKIDWRKESGSHTLMVFLFRIVIFRLMFFAGYVKLVSGDAAWWDLDALNFHYYTQPIPNALAWYAHQLPIWFQKMSVMMTLLIELLVPFFIFAPRKLRLIAFYIFSGFMGLIMVTGNYCFFNILAVLLFLFLLDDQHLRFLWIKISKCSLKMTMPEYRRWKGYKYILLLLSFLIGTMALAQTLGQLTHSQSIPRWIRPLYAWHFVNRYGLFARMTTSRNEIVMEGSRDGKTWLAYEFQWKPGDVHQRPRQVAPHQPRLDWQMWFAALGNVKSTPWYFPFVEQLLRGSSDVLGLLKYNPFGDKPPRYVRARFYEYTFTDFETKKRTGRWWNKVDKGLFCLPAELTKK